MAVHVLVFARDCGVVSTRLKSSTDPIQALKTIVEKPDPYVLVTDLNMP